jgi:hypothetical protein
MHRILSNPPIAAVDGHVDLSFADRTGWSKDMGAEVLAILAGDDRSGPFIVLSYTEPTETQMPLSFAHAHASDNWRISVRGTTNMGHDAYEQGQWRFHDGGVPYASDNFAWGPEGGFGIIMFADRRGFAIRPVKAALAAKIVPEQEAAGAFLGIDVKNPCPGAPAIATTMGPTERAHLDGGFDQSEAWEEIAPGVRMAAGISGERERGPVTVFFQAVAGAPILPARTVASETLLAPLSGSIQLAGATLRQGEVRLEESDVEQPALIAGDDGAEVVVIFTDRRALKDALDNGALQSEVLARTLAELADQLVTAGSAS